MSGRIVGEYAVYVGGTCYLPGDEVPADVAAGMGEHVFADGAASTEGGVPAKSGKGSGKEAWADYAASNGVTVDEDATRDDIIAACEAAGVPTE